MDQTAVPPMVFGKTADEAGMSVALRPPDMTPALFTAALVAEMRAACGRLFSTMSERAMVEEAVPAQRMADTPHPGDLSTPAVSADLKRMLQLRARRRRKSCGQFYDWPAWDMLLDLAAVRAEGGHVSVSSVCISSGAPQSTALRKLAALEEAKLVRRYFHGTDRRRVCVALTEEAAEMVLAVMQEELAYYQAIKR